MFEHIEYISFCGGGPCGIAFIGLFKAFEHHNVLQMHKIKGICGTSVGALFALGLVLGLNSKDMNEYVYPILSSFESVAPNLDISLFVSHYGLDDGEVMRDAISKILTKVGLSGDITLKALKNFVKHDFVCTTTNLRTRQHVFLSADTHPNLPVTHAVFMSMCIPFLFAPFEYNTDLFVDGALTMNLPSIFPAEKTMCILLEYPQKRDPITNWTDYLYSVVSCSICAQENNNSLYTSNATPLYIQLPQFRRAIDRYLNQSSISLMQKCGYVTAMLRIFTNFKPTMDMLLEMMISYHVHAATFESY